MDYGAIKVRRQVIEFMQIAARYHSRAGTLICWVVKCPPPLLLGEEVTVHRNRSNYDDTCRARVSVCVELQLTAPLEEIRGKKRQIDEPLGSTLLRLLRSTIVPWRQIPKKKKKQKYRI